MNGRFIAAAEKGNLEMIKYCVAKKCPINRWACAEAAVNGHLECLKYLREEVKAPWDYLTAVGRLKMVISTYSNILLSVSMINIAYRRVACSRERPLRLFEVLARNRQSAVGLWTPYATRTRTTKPNVYNTSSTNAVLSQSVGDTKMESYTACKHRHTHTNFVIHAPRDIHTNENFPIFLYKRRLSLSFACECNRTSGTVVFHVF